MQLSNYTQQGLSKKYKDSLGWMKHNAFQGPCYLFFFAKTVKQNITSQF